MFSLTLDSSCRNAESRTLEKRFGAMIVGLTGPDLAIFPNRPFHLDAPSCFLFPLSCSMTNPPSLPFLHIAQRASFRAGEPVFPDGSSVRGNRLPVSPSAVREGGLDQPEPLPHCILTLAP